MWLDLPSFEIHDLSRVSSRLAVLHRSLWPLERVWDATVPWGLERWSFYALRFRIALRSVLCVQRETINEHTDILSRALLSAP